MRQFTPRAELTLPDRQITEVSSDAIPNDKYFDRYRCIPNRHILKCLNIRISIKL